MTGQDQPTKSPPTSFTGNRWMNRVCPATLLWHCRGLILLLISLCGCQSDDAADRPRRLRMAHVYEVSAPTHAYGTAHLSKRLRQATTDLDVTVYPASQLGSESELLTRIRPGRTPPCGVREPWRLASSSTGAGGFKRTRRPKSYGQRFARNGRNWPRWRGTPGP